MPCGSSLVFWLTGIPFKVQIRSRGPITSSVMVTVCTGNVLDL